MNMNAYHQVSKNIMKSIALLSTRLSCCIEIKEFMNEMRVQIPEPKEYGLDII